MEELYREGRVRAIGVCNFMPDRLADLIACNEVVPALDQVEVNPFCQRWADQEFMAENKVQMQSWGPFAEGKNDIFQNPVLAAIAEAHKKSVAQVILRWLVQRRIVCITKSVRRERMEQNFAVFDFSLSEQDMEKIRGLDTGKSCFFSHYDPKIVSWLCNVRYDI